MRSHIFPQSLLKQWIKTIWQHNNEKVSFFVINLIIDENYLIKDILNEDDIKYVLNNERTFYLNIEDNLISEYEKEWNKKYEAPFLKIYHQLLNIHKQYFEGINLIKDKNIISYNKEINYGLNKYQKNKLILLNFLYLNIFRAQFIRKLSKLIDQNGNVEYKNLSEILINMNIKTNKDDIRNCFEKFKGSFRKTDYLVFIIPRNLLFMTNPPVYNEIDIFFAIPFFSFWCFMFNGSKIWNKIYWRRKY